MVSLVQNYFQKLGRVLLGLSVMLFFISPLITAENNIEWTTIDKGEELVVKNVSFGVKDIHFALYNTLSEPISVLSVYGCKPTLKCFPQKLTCAQGLSEMINESQSQLVLGCQHNIANLTVGSKASYMFVFSYRKKSSYTVTNITPEGQHDVVMFTTVNRTSLYSLVTPTPEPTKAPEPSKAPEVTQVQVANVTSNVSQNPTVIPTYSLQQEDSGTMTVIVIYGVIIFVVLGMVGFTLYVLKSFMKKSSDEKKSEKHDLFHKPMEKDKRPAPDKAHAVVDFTQKLIDDMKAKGKSDDEVKELLISQGYTEDMIRKYLNPETYDNIMDNRLGAKGLQEEDKKKKTSEEKKEKKEKVETDGEKKKTLPPPPAPPEPKENVPKTTLPPPPKPPEIKEEIPPPPSPPKVEAPSVREEPDQPSAAQSISQTTPQMVTCDACGGSVQQGWGFCPHCGKQFNVPKYCTYCGNHIEPGWKSCPYCGTQIG